jgi:xanthine/uracil/vitamin C permease (AzgA family)
VNTLFNLLGFCIITSIILGIIIYAIANITGLERNKMFEKSKDLVLIGFLVIPFFEEVVWRLLLKPTKSNFL